MAQGQKQYLVKWEIDITADSPREAAKQALEIQQDKTSEALAFDVYETATNSEIAVNLLDERTEGVDICYLPVAKAIKELEDFKECLRIDEDVDWDAELAKSEFITLGELMGGIIKKLKKCLEGNK